MYQKHCLNEGTRSRGWAFSQHTKIDFEVAMDFAMQENKWGGILQTYGNLFHLVYSHDFAIIFYECHSMLASALTKPD
jgi:hypothetical protein